MHFFVTVFPGDPWWAGCRNCRMRFPIVERPSRFYDGFTPCTWPPSTSWHVGFQIYIPLIAIPSLGVSQKVPIFVFLRPCWPPWVSQCHCGGRQCPPCSTAYPNQQQHTFYWFLLQSIPFHNFLGFRASNENSTQCFFIELLSRSKLFYRRIFQVKRWSSANAMPHSLNTAQSLKAWTLSIKFKEWMDGGMAILNASTHKIWTLKHCATITAEC